MIDNIEINEDIIRENTDKESYKAGKNYYLGNKVNDIDVEIEDLDNLEEYTRTTITSNVESPNLTLYKVDVSFDNIDLFINYDCDCNKYGFGYYGRRNMCKHVVATLLKYVYEKEQIIKVKKMVKTNNLIKQITNNINVAQRTNTYLNIDIKYEHGFSRDNTNSFVSLKIGEDKQYVVKNIKEFLICYNRSLEPMEFGKKFTYNPCVHSFKDEDLNIIELFKEAGELQSVAGAANTYKSNQVKFLSGKKAFFTDSMTKRLLKYLYNRELTVVIKGETFTNVHIEKEPMPLEFNINRDGDKFILEQNNNMPISLTSDGKFFFYEGKIYEPPVTQRDAYMPFYNRFKDEKNGCIEFYEEEKDDVASFVLPTLNKISSKVDIDMSLKNEFYIKELKAIIYFEKKSENVEALITFKYGDIEINPFNSKENKAQEGRTLIRDMDKEMNIINQFNESGFIRSENGFAMIDEEKLLEFLVSGLEKLQKMAEVYYSDEFKNISVHGNSGYKSNIRLNKENLLEFNFSIEGVDNVELKNIFVALREKRKYHRLKNGSFVLLDSNNLLKVAQMIEYLNIKDKDISKNKILLSKYNALYIEEKLKREQMDFVDTNKKFKELVYDLKNTKELQVTVPNTLDRTMRDYQKIGFKWLKTLAKCGFGGILADEMGLGKTLQAIAFIQSEVEENINKQPSLVICPTSVVYNWKDEIEKFAPTLKCIVISGNKRQRDEQKQNIKDNDVVITSYALIRRDLEDYKKIQFRYCFLD